MTREKVRTLGVLLTGVLLGAGLCAWLSAPSRPALAQPAKAEPDLQSLAKDLEAIKKKLPDQSHAMQDVSYHFGNLWFAAQHENWPLANFYCSESKSHLHWAVRIIPKRKDSAGYEIDLEALLQAVENTPLKQLEEAIKAKDKPAFEKAYRLTLEGCYNCHKASDKPFIRPQVPDTPETPIVNFDPQATWPK